MYTDYNSSQKLLDYASNNRVTSVEYGVNNPTKLDDIIRSVESLGINNIAVSKSNKNYELVTSSVESITKLTNMIRIGSVIVGVVILSLVLMFWIRGISKINLILQFAVETLMVTIFGFLSALGLEFILLKYIRGNTTSIFSEDLPKIISDELTKISINGSDIIGVIVVMITIVMISVIVALLPILKMKPKKILTQIN